MAKPKTSSAPDGAAPTTHLSPSARPVVAIPRRWLAILAALLLVPWLAVAAIYFSRTASAELPGDAPSAAVPPAAAPGALTSGPWGRLRATPIVVSPPLEYVAADWTRESGPDTWYFPSTTPDLMETFFRSVGLASNQVATLKSSAKAEPRINGLVVTPDPAVVRSLTPEVRARLYSQLAKARLNFDQANSFRFFGTSVDAWLGGALISRETRQLVEPLIYQDGGFLNFADTEIVQAQISDPKERQRLAKALLRQPTLLVELSIESPAEVDGLAEYWGRGGRRLDMRPLLESVAGGSPQHSIDIVHLLPTFARQHLYRYPKLSTGDLDKPLLANCLWSSLNFFNHEADERFLDVNYALDALRTKYYIVESNPQLGDIIGFVDDEGDLFHAAVYIAADLVFTKNGTSPMAPWTIVPLAQVTGYYHSKDDDPQLIYHRRSDF